ncbi:MAG TPA: PKD domain-containing protein [Ktedonobacterales bacterium]|nr:PKD domain-containing protein [Ktedonobacterales bacterium]
MLTALALIARLMALAILLGGGVALWTVVAPTRASDGQTQSLTLNPFRAQIAQACGLGATPTMMANNVSALAFPFNGNYAQEQIAGQFALDYPVNTPITFAENFSRVPFAPSPNSFQWQWNFGDGSPLTNGVTVTHTFTQTGTYTVESDTYDTVSKSWSQFDNAQIHIIPAAIPNPPVAKINALTPTEILGNQSITFDASGSHATVGSQLTYTWNFGDNTSATGERVKHQFVNVNGVGVVTLIATDARGAKSTASVNIAVGITLPGATGSVHASASSAHIKTPVNFNATRPNDPAGLQGTPKLVSVTWDFGDGTKPLVTQTPGATHAYAKAGNYHVAVVFVFTDSNVYVETTNVAITLAPAATTSSGGGAHWLLIGGGSLALLVVIGIAAYYWLAQQRRQHMEQLALARRQAARQRNALPRRGAPGGMPAQRTGNRGYPPGNTQTRQGASVPAARRLASDMPGQSGQYARRAPGAYGPRDPREPQRAPVSGASGSYPARRPGSGTSGRQGVPGSASGPRYSAPNSPSWPAGRPGGPRPMRPSNLRDYANDPDET